MIICKYQTMVSKNGGCFEKAYSGKFKTDTESEAKKVIDRWNVRGGFASEVKVIWSYDIISCKVASLSKWDNPNIPYRTESDC